MHAEELLQQGADALAKARQFAASAAQDRARGTDNDAAFEKWLASRFPKDKPRTPRSARPQVIPTPLHLLDHISPIFSPFFLVFCACSPSRRGGSNEPQAGTQGQETAGTRA